MTFTSIVLSLSLSRLLSRKLKVWFGGSKSHLHLMHLLTRIYLVPLFSASETGSVSGHGLSPSKPSQRTQSFASAWYIPSLLLLKEGSDWLFLMYLFIFLRQGKNKGTTRAWVHPDCEFINLNPEQLLSAFNMLYRKKPKWRASGQWASRKQLPAPSLHPEGSARHASRRRGPVDSNSLDIIWTVRHTHLGKLRVLSSPCIHCDMSLAGATG